VEFVPDLLKRSGLTVTPQRAAILEVLLQEPGHPSPEWIYRWVTERFPHLSLATVYNTLDRFEEVGLVRKVNALFGAARYDARTDFHLHAACTSCGSISDVEADFPEIEALSTLPVPDFTVQKISIHLLGLCGPCRERELVKDRGKTSET